MQRLTAFDAGFLDAEDADLHISMAVGAVSVIEGPVPDHDELINVLSERVRAVPRLRQVVRRDRFDLSAPEWVDDPTFDLAHHLHLAALPHPGDDRALFRFTAEAMEPRLDRERPLWQCWVIEGLAANRWALLMKVHHCMADGIAAMHLLAGLSDGGEGQTYAGAIRAAHTVRPDPPALPALTLNPLRWARAGWSTATTLLTATATTLGGVAEIVDGLVRRSDSSLNGPVTTMRRYSAVEVPMAQVLSVCHAFDVTLNDVALGAITDSFRSALQRRGEAPHPRALRTLVPVSVRSEDAAHRLDNRVSVMLPYLPVDEPDRITQLRTVHERLERAKASGQRQAGSLVATALNLAPFAVVSRVIRAVTSLPRNGVVTLATNVPGPQQRLQLMGRDVVRMLPIPPVALGLRTAVAILSYADSVIFGITTDFDAFPDVDELAAGIGAAVSWMAAQP
ncbi:wax ester/triacylglycerol synthase family O-acyltransferase [Mycobacterium sp. SMC-4]|uniref:wax ester/triacylglycerol synthase family O-acyltransferase n=1 Tax=Mycobacterium sp. SMC-4 TaxID=2857059 RepID=UPI0021B207E6|nr:wax ester/triacylglycerol synthase family O-acyltransferase [Mycobacterium sp. SMC-4]UXA19013.1 wax ester/triacylglycerol synthase family O-acyltransferase [Mycobacterium sp. SMC-4]